MAETSIEWTDTAWTPEGERVSKKTAGRLLDGRTWDEWPRG